MSQPVPPQFANVFVHCVYAFIGFVLNETYKILVAFLLLWTRCSCFFFVEKARVVYQRLNKVLIEFQRVDTQKQTQTVIGQLSCGIGATKDPFWRPMYEKSKIHFDI